MYNKLETEYKKSANEFKDKLKKTLFIIENYVKNLSGEVLDKRYVDNNDVVMSIKQEILNEVFDELNYEDNFLSYRREILKEKLIKIRQRELQGFNNKDLENVARMIETEFKNI